MIKSPIKCLNPQKIRNKATGELMLVPCGHCIACLLQKSSRSTLKCKLESASHKYTYFVTLTYNNENIPLCHALPNVEVCGYDFVEATPRLGEGIVLASMEMAVSSLHLLQEKCGNSMIPHLSKRDLQLFLKRLRKRLNEKIRYYAVGEYGPVHFRPHYHLLLWFDEQETFKTIGQAIRESWPFGFVNSSLSEGDAARYTAGYLNSFSHLPGILQSGECKPFALHSRFLGSQILEREKKDVYEGSFESFAKRCIPLNGRNTAFHLWRSLKATYFPRIRKYAVLSSRERYEAYAASRTAYRLTGKVYPSGQARWLVDYLYKNKETVNLTISCPFNCEDRLIAYLLDREYNLYDDSADAKNKLFHSIYMDLRTSYHFITFCCDGNQNKELPMIQKIDDFWKWCNYDSLCADYESQSEMIEQFGDEVLDVYYPTRFDKDKFQDSQLYYSIDTETQKQYNKSIKHKKLNDLNKIFENV